MDDSRDEELPAWVKVMSTELLDDEGTEEDPDYEVATKTFVIPTN